MVMMADLVTLPSVAETVTFLADVTRLAVMANVAEVAPAGMVTEEGTVAAELLLDSATTSEVAAAPFRATVPVAEFPLTSEAGRLSKLRAGG
jgi:hypothetical protein